MPSSTRLLITLAALTAMPCPAADRVEVKLHHQAVVRFASLDEAAAKLAQRDRFVRAMSRFDRDSRVRASNVTEAQYLQFVGNQAVAWNEDEIEKLSNVVRAVEAQLAPFQIPLPEQVLLIKTTGKEEGGAAYCRGNAIILPRQKLGRSSNTLQRLLIHELFHILSNHNAPLRESLYAVVGFQPCAEIPFPSALRDRKITNPDAPNMDHYVELVVDDQTVKATPVLFASVEQYEPEQGGSLFRYLRFRLMVVEAVGDKWQPVLSDDGQPLLLEADNTPSYFQRVGRNTSYIIHPEEVLADNFVYLVQGRKDLKTPRIVEQMGEFFRR